MTYTHREEGVTFLWFQWLDFKFSLARVVCEKFMIFVMFFFFLKSCRVIRLPKPQYVCSELVGIY